MAKVGIKTWNKQGTVNSYKDNEGSCTIFIDDSSYRHISVDAFSGKGGSYERREGESEILIMDGGITLFQGGFSELKERLLSSEDKKELSKWQK